MLGSSDISDTIVGNSADPTPPSEVDSGRFLPADLNQQALFFGIPGQNLVPIPGEADVWGSVTIPTAPSPTGFPEGDPALGYTLQFIYDFVVTDGNGTAAWQAVDPANPPIKSIIPNDPRDLGVINTKDLPALYMWRDSVTKIEYLAEDWLQQTTVVKGLWIFPLGLPANQRVRAPYGDALIKVIGTGIERGRTPSFQIPNDPDRRAKLEGSLFYTPANFVSFYLHSYRKIPVRIDMNNKGPAQVYPAIEMTFMMEENLEYGLGRFYQISGADATIYDYQTGEILDKGPLD